jgi:hypothetical protein
MRLTKKWPGTLQYARGGGHAVIIRLSGSRMIFPKPASHIQGGQLGAPGSCQVRSDSSSRSGREAWRRYLTVSNCQLRNDSLSEARARVPAPLRHATSAPPRHHTPSAAAFISNLSDNLAL